MWLDLVTYLHHHGHEDKLPWYRGKVWKKNLENENLTFLHRKLNSFTFPPFHFHHMFPISICLELVVFLPHSIACSIGVKYRVAR